MPLREKTRTSKSFIINNPFNAKWFIFYLSVVIEEKMNFLLIETLVTDMAREVTHSWWIFNKVRENSYCTHTNKQSLPEKEQKKPKTKNQRKQNKAKKQSRAKNDKEMRSDKKEHLSLWKNGNNSHIFIRFLKNTNPSSNPLPCSIPSTHALPNF